MNKLRAWSINVPNIATMLAFRILRRAIRNDPAYAEGWHSNIAMSIYDESRQINEHALSGAFCNNAAARFMSLCFGVDTRR